MTFKDKAVDLYNNTSVVTRNVVFGAAVLFIVFAVFYFMK